MTRIGILTSGGDCPGLNATIRGFVKAANIKMDCEFIGILDGYQGLIDNNMRKLDSRDLSGLLTVGGTLLGSKRTPFKKMAVIEEDGVNKGINKVEQMVKNYHKNSLDCLVCLGGAGTHKNANLLRKEGLNVIALPKTIDNDIWGTDVTFGYQTAVDTATEMIDRIHTTASSHDRVIVIELMGNKAGWLALNAGIAGGADVVLIPEIPYSDKEVVKAIKARLARGKDFSIVVVAEGALSKKEAAMSKSERKKHFEALGFRTRTHRIGAMIEEATGMETRVVRPGHILRGGSPTAFDRTLCTNIGAFGAVLVSQGKFGNAVSVKNNDCVASPLKDIAGRSKLVTEDNYLVKTARRIGISFAN